MYAIITEFGEFTRILRVIHREALKDMADKLNVTSSYLSAVEHGKREIPKDWYDKIVEFYSLNSQAAEDLNIAINRSKKDLIINISGKNTDDKDIAIAFARKFDTLDEEQKKSLKNLFK